VTHELPGTVTTKAHKCPSGGVMAPPDWQPLTHDGLRVDDRGGDCYIGLWRWSGRRRIPRADELWRPRIPDLRVSERALAKWCLPTAEYLDDGLRSGIPKGPLAGGRGNG
jgi:hypothetical protein